MVIPDIDMIRNLALNDVTLYRCLQRHDMGHCTLTDAMLLYALIASKENARLKSDAVDNAINCTCKKVVLTTGKADDAQ